MKNSKESKSKSENHAEVLDRIKKAVKNWYSYYSDNIENYNQDVTFVHGNQWTDVEKREHDALKKPTFTMNKLYPYIKQLIGEQRQNTPSLEVRGEEENVPQEAIDLRSGMIKYICYSSNSKKVYQESFSCSTKGGFGAFRIITEYESSDSFNQVIKYETVPDPTVCFWDPNAKESHKEDGSFCGIYKVLSKDYFKKLYPDVDVDMLYKMSLGSSYANSFFRWMPDENTVTIVEFYEKQCFTKKLALLSNGETIEEKYFDDYVAAVKREMEMQGIQAEPIKIERRRDAEDYKIMHYKAVGTEILEETEWPSKYLPIVFVLGDGAFYEGKEWTVSFIRYARDAQKFLNYLKSDIAQAILLMRREQFLGTPENIPNNPKAEAMWKNPAAVQGMLIAARDRTGNLPTKLPPTELSQSEMQQYQIAEADIQNILGMYEAVRGAQGAEISGIAVQNKVRQGNLTNFIYFDNLNRAIEHAGKIVLEMLPRVYDTERVVPLIDANNKSSITRINHFDETGKMQNELYPGAYQIEIRAGAPFGMQKQEQFLNVMQLVEAVPGYGQMTIDKLAALLDVENTSEFVDRAKLMLPPQVQAQESGQPMPPDPQQQVQQQMMQVEQQKVMAAGMKAQADQMSARAKMVEAVGKTTGSHHDLAATHMQSQAQIVKSQAEITKAVMEYQTEMARVQSEEEGARLRDENIALKRLLSQII